MTPGIDFISSYYNLFMLKSPCLIRTSSTIVIIMPEIFRSGLIIDSYEDDDDDEDDEDDDEAIFIFIFYILRLAQNILIGNIDNRHVNMYQRSFTYRITLSSTSHKYA